jgi:hypothetical protein
LIAAALDHGLKRTGWHALTGWLQQSLDALDRAVLLYRAVQLDAQDASIVFGNNLIHCQSLGLLVLS